MSAQIKNSNIKKVRKSVSKSKATRSKGKGRKKTSRKKKAFVLDKNNLILVSGAAALVLVVIFAVGVILGSSGKKETEDFSSGVSLEQSIADAGNAAVKKNKSAAKNASSGKDNSAKKEVAAADKNESSEKKSDSGKKAETSSAKNDSVKNDSSGKNSAKENSAKQAAPVKTEVNASAKKDNVKQNTSASAKKDTASEKKEPAPEKKAPVTPAPAPVPAPKYDIPAAVGKPALVFVFDDAGHNVTKLKKYTSLKMPLTIAVLPKLAHSAECAEEIRRAGKEVILHQPMQAENLNINPGPGALKPEMTTFEIAEQLKENIREVGPVKGLNNHEGSLITEDEIRIGTVLDVAFENNMYFLDSRTTAATKAPQAALERDMTILERDVFLDDVVNRDEILKQIYRALGVANKKGKAIIIGHVDKSVDIIPSVLEEMYPLLLEKGYRVCYASDLLK